VLHPTSKAVHSNQNKTMGWCSFKILLVPLIR